MLCGRYVVILCLLLTQQESEEQHRILTAKTEDLEKKLEAERLLKERELWKTTTAREKEVAEYKKQLASITEELETEKQKQAPAQEVTLSLSYL